MIQLWVLMALVLSLAWLYEHTYFGVNSHSLKKRKFNIPIVCMVILLGGFLADSVFEPFMASGSAFAGLLHRLVGYGSGSGMAVMFLCTSICGALFSIICYRSKGMDELRGSAVKGGAEK